MIRVNRSNPKDPKWDAWHEHARQATEALCERVAKGDEPEIDDKIYKGAMDYLLALTHGKCAYCESDIRTTHPGDVEHYRPKGGVRDESGKTVRVKVGNAEVDHKGYWWLAYEWENLLPSCIDCNRTRKHAAAEKGGKGELFPVRGFRAVKRGEESKEEPLLLNPTLKDPSEHLEFLEDGKIKPKTDIGEESCKILGLNIRESLVRARAERFMDAKAALGQLLVFLTYAIANPSPRSVAELSVRQKLNDMWNGDTTYGACASLALRRAIDFMTKNGVPVRFPLDV